MREYTPAELVGLAAKFQQKARESIRAWLLQPWDALPGGSAPSPSSLQRLPGKWRQSGPGLQGQRGGSLALCLRCAEAVKCGVEAGTQEPTIPASRSSLSLLITGGPSQ